MHSKFHRRSPVLLVLAGVLLFSAFTGFCQPSGPSQSSSTSVQKSADAQRRAREQMVQQQIAARGVRDPRVLQAMRDVPRHLFVPPEMQQHAYQDTPLPIGYGQTISQPYIVGFMTEALKLKPQDRVLEVGTGSGYQAAILSVLVREVYSIEIVEPLATQAAERLKRLGYANVKVRAGDGFQGWPEAAPFDAIIVTAAPDHVPKPLLDQLAPGGRLVIPVGEFFQTLKRIVRTDRGFKTEELLPVRFVPMTGEAQK
jgi:protein-L-isoaspartate(D-aspartate) O-methyltransferase